MIARLNRWLNKLVSRAIKKALKRAKKNPSRRQVKSMAQVPNFKTPAYLAWERKMKKIK